MWVIRTYIRTGALNNSRKPRTLCMHISANVEFETKVNWYRHQTFPGQILNNIAEK